MRRLNNKINILFVMMYLKKGGSENLVNNIALKLDRRFFNPSIVCLFEDRVLKELNRDEVPVYYVPKVGRFDISTIKGIGDIIKKNNIHIVNAHHFMPMIYSFYGCKIKNNCRLIYTEHAKSEVDKISWKWRKIGGYLLNHSDAAVGITKDVSEAIQDRFNLHSSKVITIKNGVDLDAYLSCNNREGLKKELKIAKDEKIIGIVANLKKIKNHIFLLRAFNELTKSYNRVKLLIIGQGFENDSENTEAELRAFVDKNGLKEKVLFLGHRQDIPDLLNIMDIFCLTSFSEGLPTCLIEAMAAGLPIVGTDVEGIREVIMPDKNGFLIQLNDINGIKNALKILLLDKPLREKFIQQSIIFARTYSLDQCVNDYQNLFLSVTKDESI